MSKAGVPEDMALAASEAAVCADIRGVSSHGVVRLSKYAERIQLGLINRDPKPHIVLDYSSLVKIDADNGLGQYTTRWATKEAIRRAKEFGSCSAVISNSNHIGMLSYYALMAAKENMIAYIMCNTPPLVVPYGGRQAAIGTNPLCWSIPAHDFPIILDMAISPAKGKIRNMQLKNEPVPEGWCLDKDGYPTTDPNKAMEGALLPIAGPKGYGMGVVVECMAAILSGAHFGRQVTQPFDNMETSPNLGIFMLFIDVEKLIPIDEFMCRVNDYKLMIKSTEKQSGVEEIFLPGELEYLREMEAYANGMRVDDILYQMFTKE